MTYVRLSDLADNLGQSAEDLDKAAAALEAQAAAFESQAAAFAGRPEALNFAGQAKAFRAQADNVRRQAATQRAEAAALTRSVTDITTAAIQAGAEVGKSFLTADAIRRAQKASQQPMPQQPFVLPPVQQPSSGISPGLAIGLGLAGLAIVGGIAVVVATRKKESD